MESYAPFPFLAYPAARDYGGTFELRTYHLVPGGLPATMAGWKEAIGPAQRYTDHLVTAMYALDGNLRITHIWGFTSVEERNALRREHYAAGLWPPIGGPENIDHAFSTIALAVPGFPICWLHTTAIAELPHEPLATMHIDLIEELLADGLSPSGDPSDTGAHAIAIIGPFRPDDIER